MDRSVTASMKAKSGFIQHRSGAGFTLVELMVVISITAVLSVVGIVVYSGAQLKARDSVRKSDLNNLATALELYNQTKGNYFIGDTNTFYSNSDMINFMNGSMPYDPLDPQDKSRYYYTSNGQSYTLCAKLENKSDSDKNLLCPDTDTSYNYGVIPK